MVVKFLFTDIRNINDIYRNSNRIDSSSNKRAQRYFTSRMNTLKSNIKEIKNINILDDNIKYGSFTYNIICKTSIYKVLLTIDTHKSDSYLTIQIDSHKINEKEMDYDYLLEEIKFNLKSLFKKNWKNCFWIIDEQSEELSMKVYKRINRIENQFRAFVDLVFRYSLGAEWFNNPEFTFVIDSYKKSSSKFKNVSNNYKDINDILISTTIETLNKCINVNIYKKDININSDQIHRVIELILNDKKPQSLQSKMRDMLEIEYNVWNDIFAKYFSNDDKTFKVISEFIEIRNHIAHNKPIDYKPYQIMLEKIYAMENMLNKAEINFYTMIKSKETAKNNEIHFNMRFEEYQRRIIDAVGGGTCYDYPYSVAIRDKNDIIKLFFEKLHIVYNEIKQKLSTFEFNISDLTVSKDKVCHKQKIFKIFKEINKKNYQFEFYVSFDINADAGESSIMCLSIEDREEIILKKKIEYDNGEINEDYIRMNATKSSESFYDEPSQQEFISEVYSLISKLCSKSKVC